MKGFRPSNSAVLSNSGGVKSEPGPLKINRGAQELRTSRNSPTSALLRTNSSAPTWDSVYNMSKPDPLSWTLLFKKHKTTVLLMLLSQESIASTKNTLLEALKARGLTEINGDPLPEEPSDIEFGVPVDKNDLEKGWTQLEADAPELGDAEEAPRRNAGKKSNGSTSLQAANLRNGQSLAFRFKKHGGGDNIDIDQELEDPGWDVVVPKFDDEEELEQ